MLPWRGCGPVRSTSSAADRPTVGSRRPAQGSSGRHAGAWRSGGPGRLIRSPGRHHRRSGGPKLTLHEPWGTSLEVLQKVLGHASRKTTSVYVELARAEMDRQLQENAL